MKKRQLAALVLAAAVAGSGLTLPPDPAIAAKKAAAVQKQAKETEAASVLTVATQKQLDKALSQKKLPKKLIIKTKAKRTLRLDGAGLEALEVVIRAPKANITVAKGTKLKKITIDVQNSTGKLLLYEAAEIEAAKADGVVIRNRTGEAINVKTPNGSITVKDGKNKKLTAANTEAKEAEKPETDAKKSEEKTSDKKVQETQAAASGSNGGTTYYASGTTTTETQQDDLKKAEESNKQTKQEKAEESNKQTEQEKAEESNKQTEKHVFADEAKTRLLNLGFIQYVVVQFEDGYNTKNTKLVVDGVDVTRAASKVSDDGSVVKWEITSLNPGKLELVNKNDDSDRQEITLSKNTAPIAPVVVDEPTAPDYIMGYASIPSWEYYLSSYDNDGNLRVNAKKTTFDQKLPKQVSLSEVPYYSPAAEAVEGNAVQIMFNYNTDAQKAWFDTIPETGALELVSNNENQVVINGHLNYTITKEEHHGGMVGVLNIPVGQDNFTANGKYRVRIKPTGQPAIMIMVHLVDKNPLAISLKESSEIRPGQNVHFQIDGLMVGLKEPVEKAVLTDPAGKSHELTFVNDYYLYNGGLFVLYNDVQREDGTNYTPYNGIYTLTLDIEGYKLVSKRFEVTGGVDAAETISLRSRSGKAGLKLDSVSGATMVSTGDSDSSSGGSNYVSANILFNADLLINALIFDRLGIENPYAEGIVKRYETELVNVTAVYDKTGATFYDWMSYRNAVSDAKLDEGRYLSFAEYKNSSQAKETNKVTRVKEVLEDNLLGELIDDGSYIGQETELILQGTGEITLEESVAYAGDTDYLNNIQALYVDERINYYGTSSDEMAVPKDAYEVKDGLLIVKGSAFATNIYHPEYAYGKHTLYVIADGYRRVEVTVTIVYKQDDPAGGDDPVGGDDPSGDDPAGGEVKSVAAFQDAQLSTPNGTTSVPVLYKLDYAGTDCTNWLNAITEVTINGTAYKKGSVGYNGIDPRDGEFIPYASFSALYFDGTAMKSGKNEIVVKADGYETLTYTFGEDKTDEGNTGSDEGQGGDSGSGSQQALKSVEAFKNVPITAPNGTYSDPVLLKANFSGTDFTDWFDGITRVVVNGTNFSETTDFFKVWQLNPDAKEYIRSKDYSALYFGVAQQAAGSGKILVEAEGYETLELSYGE